MSESFQTPLGDVPLIAMIDPDIVPKDMEIEDLLEWYKRQKEMHGNPEVQKDITLKKEVPDKQTQQNLNLAKIVLGNNDISINSPDWPEIERKLSRVKHASKFLIIEAGIASLEKPLIPNVEKSEKEKLNEPNDELVDGIIKIIHADKTAPNAFGRLRKMVGLIKDNKNKQQDLISLSQINLENFRELNADRHQSNVLVKIVREFWEKLELDKNNTADIDINILSKDVVPSAWKIVNQKIEGQTRKSYQLAKREEEQKEAQKQAEQQKVKADEHAILVFPELKNVKLENIRPHQIYDQRLSITNQLLQLAACYPFSPNKIGFREYSTLYNFSKGDRHLLKHPEKDQKYPKNYQYNLLIKMLLTFADDKHKPIGEKDLKDFETLKFYIADLFEQTINTTDGFEAEKILKKTYETTSNSTPDTINPLEKTMRNIWHYSPDNPGAYTLEATDIYSLRENIHPGLANVYEVPGEIDPETRQTMLDEISYKVKSSIIEVLRPGTIESVKDILGVMYSDQERINIFYGSALETILTGERMERFKMGQNFPKVGIIDTVIAPEILEIYRLSQKTIENSPPSLPLVIRSYLKWKLYDKILKKDSVIKSSY